MGPLVELSAEELARYDRQIGPGVLAADGQLRLKRSRVLVSRVGGMGGPAALGLAMAGVGRIVLAHGGTLISPDLNRQTLGSEAGLGLPRAEQFAEHLRARNRFVEVEAIDREPDDAESRALARRVDLIVSAAPTFAERLRLCDAAVQAGIPLVDAAQWGMTGTLIVVDPGRTACLRCVYPEEPPFEEDFPVVGAISSAVGALAALEAIKILSKTGEPLFGRMWMIDAYRGRSAMIQLRRDPDCTCCRTTLPRRPEAADNQPQDDSQDDG